MSLRGVEAGAQLAHHELVTLVHGVVLAREGRPEGGYSELGLEQRIPIEWVAFHAVENDDSILTHQSESEHGVFQNIGRQVGAADEGEVEGLVVVVTQISKQLLGGTYEHLDLPQVRSDALLELLADGFHVLTGDLLRQVAVPRVDASNVRSWVCEDALEQPAGPLAVTGADVETRQVRPSLERAQRRIPHGGRHLGQLDPLFLLSRRRLSARTFDRLH